MTFIYIGLAVIIVFLYLSNRSLRALIKRSNSNNRNGINDERYYELKYKLQYITSIGVVIVAIAGFFGYDKYETFVNKFDKKADSLDVKLSFYNKRLSQFDSLISTYDKKIDIYDDFIEKIQKDRRIISSDFKKSNVTLLQLRDTIGNIKKRNILDKSFYLVDNLKIYKNEDNQIRGKIYFKDLKTIIGDNLPEFQKVPFLLIVPKTSALFDIISITTDYVEVGVAVSNRWQGDEIHEYKFGIMISKKN